MPARGQGPGNRYVRMQIAQGPICRKQEPAHGGSPISRSGSHREAIVGKWRTAKSREVTLGARAGLYGFPVARRVCGFFGYRAHNGTLQTGAPVPPSTPFFDAMPPEKKAVEKFLASFAPPTGPKRENVVFLFEDEAQGRRWAARERRTLYRVELKERDLLLRADWCWLQTILRGLADRSQQTTEWARNYWAGQPTGSPVWEFLAASATVVEEIPIPQLERNRLRLEAHRQVDPIG